MQRIKRFWLSAMLAGAAVAITGAAAAGGYQVEYAFGGGVDAAYPSGGLVGFGSKLFGTSGGGGGSGSIFAFDPATGAENVVYSFKGGADGSNPNGGLIMVGTKLWGTTFVGGSTTCGGGCGTVFSFDPATGVETVVHAFQHVESDGELPASGLIEVGGVLFGTTKGGGPYGVGTLFSFNPATGLETPVYVFKGMSDGELPTSNLIAVNGKLYGTTTSGGGTSCDSGGGCGTIFSFDPSTGAESVVYSFKSGNDGADPAAGLIDVGGKLYGTTVAGGGPNFGTVFSFDLNTGVERVVHAFAGRRDGMEPYEGLTRVGKNLYGTTLYGTATKIGTVFAVDLKTHSERVMHVFKGGNDGSIPEGYLYPWNGKLYGESFDAGAHGYGAIFSINP